MTGNSILLLYSCVWWCPLSVNRYSTHLLR